MNNNELKESLTNTLNSILSINNMTDLDSNIVFGARYDKEKGLIDCVEVSIGNGESKKSVITSPSSLVFKSAVESLILDIRAARQEVPKGS